jgi:hypothetical protein
MQQALHNAARPVSPDLAEQVREHGWVHLQTPRCTDSLENTMLQIASTLGETVCGRDSYLVEILRPLRTENAKPNSLSRQHGLRLVRFLSITTVFIELNLRVS